MVQSASNAGKLELDLQTTVEKVRMLSVQSGPYEKYKDLGGAQWPYLFAQYLLSYLPGGIAAGHLCTLIEN